MTQPVRRLRLRRLAVTNIDAAHFSAYRLRVEAVAADNMDTRVFVYRRDPVDPYTNDVTDTFFTVASPVDMSAYPPEVPNAGNAQPFFRKNFVELDFRSTETAMGAWEMIVSEISTLIDGLNRLDELTVLDDFWIGPFPEDPFHGSASISEPV